MGDDLDATTGFQNGLIETLWVEVRITTQICDCMEMERAESKQTGMDIRTFSSIDLVKQSRAYNYTRESSLWRGKRRDQDSVLAVWLNGRRLIRCLGLSMPCFIDETVSEAEPKRGSPSMASYTKGFSDLRKIPVFSATTGSSASPFHSQV